jgi:hypothetical protein
MKESTTTEPQHTQMPWARTYEGWEAISDQQYTAKQKLNLAEITPLFIVYRECKSPQTEYDLVEWIMLSLTKKAKHSYKQVWKSSAAGTYHAELNAAKKTMNLARKLKADFFESPSHLLGTIGDICSHFYSDAQKDRKSKVRQIKAVPFEVSWEGEDGAEVCFEHQSTSLTQPVFTPWSDPEAAAEEHGEREKAAKRSLVRIPECKPHDFMTAENTLLTGYIPPSDADLLDTLQECEWNRVNASDRLNLSYDTLCKQILRIGKKFQQIRMLIMDFRLPKVFREPIEHKDDLTHRFMSYVSSLQRKTRSEFPKTFELAFAECAQEQRSPTGEIQYERHEVIGHLLRIWRKPQTTN